MAIKKDRADEFVAWMAYMNSVGEVTATAFFNLLCQNSSQGYDVLLIVSNVLICKECDRPYEASNNDVYLAMSAFSNFHEMGDSFRRNWNLGEMGAGYARYIEDGTVKHIATPFPWHSILDLYTSDEENDCEDDDNGDSWKGGEQ